MLIQVVSDNGVVLTTATLKPKSFASGSRGFTASVKAEVPNGPRYQVGINAVEIGSKPKADAEPKSRTRKAA